MLLECFGEINLNDRYGPNAEIAKRILDRTGFYYNPEKNSPYMTGLIKSMPAILDATLPRLPENFTYHDGQISAVPGSFFALLNYSAEQAHEEWFLTPDHADWQESMKRLLQNELVVEAMVENFLRLHIVSYPKRALVMQYLLPLLQRGNLNVVDMGAGPHICLPMINHPLFLEEDYANKNQLLAQMGIQNPPNVDINLGIGVEYQPTDLDWVKAGYYLNSTYRENLELFEVCSKISESSRQRYPIIQADALEQIVKTGSIDAILASFVVHQLPDKERFFSNCSRILKDNGMVVVIGEELYRPELMGKYEGWVVKVYVKDPSSHEMKYVATPFYLTDDQRTVLKADLSEFAVLQQRLQNP